MQVKVLSGDRLYFFFFYINGSCAHQWGSKPSDTQKVIPVESVVLWFCGSAKNKTFGKMVK